MDPQGKPGQTGWWPLCPHTSGHRTAGQGRSWLSPRRGQRRGYSLHGPAPHWRGFTEVSRLEPSFPIHLGCPFHPLGTPAHPRVGDSAGQSPRRPRGRNEAPISQLHLVSWEPKSSDGFWLLPLRVEATGHSRRAPEGDWPPAGGHLGPPPPPPRTHLEAVVLAQDAAVHGLDHHLLLHAEVQRLHRAAGAEQGLVGARLFQPGHQMRPGGGRQECQVSLPCPLPSPLLPGGLPRTPCRGHHTPQRPQSFLS